MSAWIAGFRLGIDVFKDAEVIDYADPYGVFSVARRFDPELDVFLIAETLRPVQTQAGLMVLPYGYRAIAQQRTMEYQQAYNLYRQDIEVFAGYKHPI